MRLAARPDRLAAGLFARTTVLSGLGWRTEHERARLQGVGVGRIFGPVDRGRDPDGGQPRRGEFAERPLVPGSGSARDRGSGSGDPLSDGPEGRLYARLVIASRSPIFSRRPDFAVMSGEEPGL